MTYIPQLPNAQPQVVQAIAELDCQLAFVLDIFVNSGWRLLVFHHAINLIRAWNSAVRTAAA